MIKLHPEPGYRVSKIFSVFRGDRWVATIGYKSRTDSWFGISPGGFGYEFSSAKDACRAFLRADDRRQQRKLSTIALALLAHAPHRYGLRY